MIFDDQASMKEIVFIIMKKINQCEFKRALENKWMGSKGEFLEAM